MREAEIGTDRLFGRNQSLWFSGEISETDHLLSIGYEAPELIGQNPVFGIRAYRHQINKGAVLNFDTVSCGAVPYLRWTLGGGTEVMAGVAYSHDTISNLPAGGSAILRPDAGDRDRLALRLGISRGFAMPQASWGVTGQAELTQDIAVTSRDTSFLVSQGSLSMQATHPGGAVRVSGALTGGTVQMLRGNSNVGDRFFLGQSLVRGFAFGGIGPVDQSVAGSPALGGNSYVGAQFDFRFPGAIPGAAKFTPGLFADAGSVFGLNTIAGDPAGLNAVDDGLHLRASIGLSLSYDTGFGEISAYVGQAVLKQTNDRTEQIQVSFGAKF
ncbi:BamA/TamA family outer membrane protein [Rhodobacteraceae bacterium ASV31]|nr:BamA/TamA family outer membrane protein [Anianabacter salinae]